MCAALTELMFEYLDGRRWRLRGNFAWRFLDGITLVVLAGFVSDMHSVPRLFWWLVPPHFYGEAAVVHDWLYSRQGNVEVAGPDGIVRVEWSRRECDERYREMLKERGAGWLRRWTMYGAVRSGGWIAWRRDV